MQGIARNCCSTIESPSITIVLDEGQRAANASRSSPPLGSKGSMLCILSLQPADDARGLVTDQSCVVMCGRGTHNRPKGIVEAHIETHCAICT